MELEQEVSDMSSLPVDPADGFLGQNIFPPPVSSPSYMSIHPLESSLPFHEWRVWIGSRPRLPVHFVFLYMMGIFLGQIWMKRRKPFSLRRTMIFWNFSLAAFSLLGFVRSWPEVWEKVGKDGGFYEVTCSREGYNSASAYWSLLGIFSKVVELGDTGFLVLRKRPVIFLHWFHHATVLLYTWGTFEYLDPSHRWFTVMNYFVHSIMYSYYGLRAVGIRLPKSASMGVTTLQIMQMLAGVWINVYSLYAIHEGIPCARSVRNVQLILVMYFAYLILFGNFFYSNYLEEKKGKKCRCE